MMMLLWDSLPAKTVPTSIELMEYPPEPPDHPPAPLALASFAFNDVILLGRGADLEGRMEEEIRFRAEAAYEADQLASAFSLTPDELRLAESKRAEDAAFLAALEAEASEVSMRCQSSTSSSEATTSSVSVPLHLLAARSPVVFSLASSARASLGRFSDLDLEQYHDFSVSALAAYVLEPSLTPDSLFTDENLVELCELSHYLDISPLHDASVRCILASLDRNNCVSLLMLADKIQNQTLLEGSMSKVVESLNDIEKNPLQALHWNECSADLKNVVLTMRNAVSSSILGRGGSSKLFFSSYKEFLGIFRESIRMQEDRLLEARLENADVVRVRNAEQRGRGAQRDARDDPDVVDAQRKIEKQAARVETLKAYYASQEEIFDNQQQSSAAVERRGPIHFVGAEQTHSA